MSNTMLIHATAIAIGGDAMLLRGPSGAGKSDLALRLLALDLGFVEFPRSTHPPLGPPPPCGEGLGVTHDAAAKGSQPVDRVSLVADDQVRLVRSGGDLIASAPETIRGLLEVRGLGIVRMPHVETARVRLIIDLVPVADVPRMPPEDDTVDLLGVMIPRLRLHAFEASAPLKCARALHGAIYGATRSSAP